MWHIEAQLEGFGGLRDTCCKSLFMSLLFHTKETKKKNK